MEGRALFAQKINPDILHNLINSNDPKDHEYFREVVKDHLEKINQMQVTENPIFKCLKMQKYFLALDAVELGVTFIPQNTPIIDKFAGGDDWQKFPTVNAVLFLMMFNNFPKTNSDFYTSYFHDQQSWAYAQLFFDNLHAYAVSEGKKTCLEHMYNYRTPKAPDTKFEPLVINLKNVPEHERMARIKNAIGIMAARERKLSRANLRADEPLFDVNSPEFEGLHLAAANNQKDIVLWLIHEKGADPKRTLDNKTPLQVAFYSNKTTKEGLNYLQQLTNETWPDEQSQMQTNKVVNDGPVNKIQMNSVEKAFETGKGLICLSLFNKANLSTQNAIRADLKQKGQLTAFETFLSNSGPKR